MRLNFLPYIILFLLAFPAISEGKTAAKKKTKTYFKLLEATSQRTLPGIPGAAVKTDYNFTITWLAATYPETFFWVGEGGRLPCGIRRVHKAPEGKGYTFENVLSRNIHKGDTLRLVPVTGGKLPVPDEIPATAQNTLYFKTVGSNWLSYPVKNIRRLPDIANP
jgi:hypothetical protein